MTMLIFQKLQYVICLFFVLMFFCARHCQRAFYIPNATLSNINKSGQLLESKKNIRLYFEDELLFRHEIDTGQNVILLISDLRSVSSVRDVDSYRLITIELPVHSLSSNGQHIIDDNSLDKIKNTVTSGGIQWIKNSGIGSIKHGSIKYCQKKDSLYSINLNLNIGITPIEDSCENYFFNYNKKIKFKKGNLNNFQKIPESPCPQMYLSH